MEELIRAISPLLDTIVGGVIGIIGSWVANKQSADAARVLALAVWRREVHRQAYDNAMAALPVGRRLHSLRESPNMEEQVELTSGFIDPLISARIAFGLETSQETRMRLISAFAALLTALNQDHPADAERRVLSEITTAWIAEIQAAWSSTVEGRA